LISARPIFARFLIVLKYILNDCKLNGSAFSIFIYSKVGGKLVFLRNLAPKDARKLYIKDVFIQEVIELWKDIFKLFSV